MRIAMNLSHNINAEEQKGRELSASRLLAPE